MLKCFYIFAQEFGGAFAGSFVAFFGFDGRAQALVLLAEALFQFGVFGHPVDELPHAPCGRMPHSQVLELFLAVPDDELFYVLVGLVAPS